MNWLGKMIGLPSEFLHQPGKTGGGVIQTTASEATLVCLLAARTRAIKNIQKNDPDRLPVEINSNFVAYCSDQVRSRFQFTSYFELMQLERNNYSKIILLKHYE